MRGSRSSPVAQPAGQRSGTHTKPGGKAGQHGRADLHAAAHDQMPRLMTRKEGHEMRRRTLLKGAMATALTPLAAPAIAQSARVSTLRLIPQSNLTVLDPIWTTATVTGNHGYHVYDTLYSAD